ncbi:MAG: hypothetical protein IIX27_01685 [Ruminococcus sp.]|nr:hypothetical protein [Ruminococcus sp.]
MLLLSVAIPVSAEEVAGPLNKDKFYERYYEVYETFYGGYTKYLELYYHHTDNGNPESTVDWVLINCFLGVCDSWGMGSYVVVGDRVIGVTDTEFVPFDIPYAIYDVNKDEFIGIENVDCNQYDGLIECIQELNLGLLVGDINRDKVLSVVDATIIQRCIAQLEEFPVYDVCEKSGYSAVYGGEQLAYYSDFNRDGERTILDATAIQMKLAKIEAE